MQSLLDERQRLLGRIEQETEQLERLQSIVSLISQRLADDERLVADIDEVLGRTPQMKLEDGDLRLRGRRLAEVALEVLHREHGDDVEIHYRDWFDLVRAEGHLVAGKVPLNNFLAQINRVPTVEPVGSRTGLYRVARAA